jgi:hypothetical protein
MYLCVVLCIVCFVSFPVLFLCICVLNNCHRVAIQLQLNVSYHITVHPVTGHEGPEVELRYSSTLSLSSALGGGGWSKPSPRSFTPGPDPAPIV